MKPCIEIVIGFPLVLNFLKSLIRLSGWKVIFSFSIILFLVTHIFNSKEFKAKKVQSSQGDCIQLYYLVGRSEYENGCKERVDGSVERKSEEWWFDLII